MKNDLDSKLLKDTIVALREELEKAQSEEQEHIQGAVVEANAEIRQLRAAILELRELLELREAEHEEAVQRLRLQHRHEISELRQTVSALRQKLEESNESRQTTRAAAKTAASAGTSH